MRTRISRKFNRCVKSVKKTVKARRGSNKESAAIAICTKSVLQKRGRTMKRYTRKRLTTQKKFRAGGTPSPWEKYEEKSNTVDLNRLDDVATEIRSDASLTGDLEELDMPFVEYLFIAGIKSGSRPLLEALHQKGVSKEFMLQNIDELLEGDIPEDDRAILNTIRGFVANLS